MSNEKDEPFLSRWSRRKRSGAARPDASPQSDGPANTSVAATAEPPFDLTKLPKLEDLTPSSDFAQFLQKGVPEELKRLALRKAWSLDPAIRDFVEVAENQYDWNIPGGVPGFGEIAPGTDLKSLLLQATGQLPDPIAAPTTASNPAQSEAVISAPSDEPLRTFEDQPAAASSQFADHPSPPSDQHPGHEPSAAMPPIAAPASSPNSGQATPAPVKRRRHGSALPPYGEG